MLEGTWAAARATLPQVFARLAVVDILRVSRVNRQWNQASECAEAWTGVVLTAFQTAEPADDEHEHSNSVALMNDTVLDCLARKLKRVGDSRGLSAVPPPIREGAPRSDKSPLQLRKMDFGRSVYWCLAYNTKEFGWFDREHTTTFATGLKIWAPCPLLCRWFSAGQSMSEADNGMGRNIKGRSVLELGAGIGMLGVVMARLGAQRVLITDGNQLVLRIATVNAHINSASNALVRRLSYGREPALEFRDTHGRFDDIVGADIIYTISAIRLVFESADVLLADEGVVSLGFIERDDSFVAELQAVSKEFNFELVHSCFLSEALGGKKPQVTPARCATGMLAELKKVLDRMPKGGACLGESEEKVQLFEYRRSGVHNHAQPMAEPSRVFFDELD